MAFSLIRICSVQTTRSFGSGTATLRSFGHCLRLVGYQTGAAVRVWTGGDNSSPSLPTNLHLPPLTNRRTYFKLVCTYKFLYGHLYCPPDFLNLHPNPNLRVFHSKQLVQPLAKTVSYYHSFFISAVKLWNSLPRDIVLLDSLSLFKSSLRSHLCI